LSCRLGAGAKEIIMIYGVSRTPSRAAGKTSTLLALGLAIAAAVAGAVLWGLVALLIHRQLSLIGLLIGLGAGSAVARYRPGHRPTIVAGAIIAVAGCALGTLLAIVFTLLDEQVTLSTIVSNINVILRGYPSAVGGLGLLFWLIAAFAAIRVPLRSQRAAPEQLAAGQFAAGQFAAGQFAEGSGAEAPAGQVAGGQTPERDSAADTPAANIPAAAAPAAETPAADGTGPVMLAPMTDTAPGAGGEPAADIPSVGGYGTAADEAS
jgi:hypothetical protein